MRTQTNRWLAGVAVVATAVVTLFGTGSPGGGFASATVRTVECDPQGPPTISARARPGTPGAEVNSYSSAEAATLNRKLERRYARAVALGRVADVRRAARKPVFQIDTYVHVITREDGTGGVTQEQVDEQMRVLNRAFKGGGVSAKTAFRFVVREVDYTANDAWHDWNLLEDYSDEDDEAKAAKEALHRGTFEDLNIYIAALGGGLLGYASFPGSGTPLALDGLVLLNESLPGGAAAPYNLGDTATHEIGHWMGLFHTFENGCAAPGDYVGDTPYQLDGDNIFGCNVNDDTCRAPRKDPVHNYMSYGDDECMNRFTSGQQKRMNRSWFAFRYKH